MEEKEKFIEVYDDILPLWLVNNIEETVLFKTKYIYLPNITFPSDTTKYIPGFTHNFIDIEKQHQENSIFYFNQILYRLCQYKNINLQQIIQGRIFLHIPTSLTSTPDVIHVDLDFPHWVCLYYVCDSDGDTILFDDIGNEIKRVSPKKGRIVFFDGSINHCSSKPTKTHRAILNFDFIGEKL